MKKKKKKKTARVTSLEVGRDALRGAYVLKLFGGDALPPLWCILSGVCELTCAFRPLVLRTCLRIQARRLVRQLCSDSTNLDQGLHSTTSRAEMATARPTWTDGCKTRSSYSGDKQ